MPRLLKFVCLVPVLLGLVYAPSPARGADSYNELFGLGSHSVDTRLEHWYKLQETTGTSITDSSGNGNTGTAGGWTNPTTVTGPTGYYSSAISFDGTDDYITVNGSAAVISGASSLAVTCWAKEPTGNGQRCGALYEGAYTGDVQITATVGGSTNYGKLTGNARASGTNDETTAITTNTTGTEDGGWHAVGWNLDPVNDTINFYVDGTNYAATYSEQTAGISFATCSLNLALAARTVSGPTQDAFLTAQMAGWAFWNTKLTGPEHTQIAAGPEPIYSGGGISSPVGTYTVGQTLTAVTDSGNWDTQSNGTLVYAFQWIRADDGTGTNAAEISGATSSTYTLGSGDSGKHIACDILASNDGGSDAAEETRSAYTSQVSGGGGGPAITPITTSIPGSSVDPIRGTIP